MVVEGERLWDLLRSLDDADHLEFPADFDFVRTRSRFDQLAARLDTAFNCTSQVDRHVEDASYHARIEIPSAATATRLVIVIVVSNFGNLAVVAVDNPGVWTQEEFTELLHRDDAERIYAALDDLDYIVVPEEPLWNDYDGNSNLRQLSPDHRATWWIRYFDYL